MHPVGDVGDRILLGRDLGPDVALVRGGDPAVHRTHAVVIPRTPQREGGHVEVIDVAVVAEAEHAADVDAGRGAVAAEMGVDELPREDVVAGGHGCVGREHARCCHRLDRRFERQSRRDLLAATLEELQRRVPLVQVPNGRCEPERA